MKAEDAKKGLGKIEKIPQSFFPMLFFFILHPSSFN